MLSGKKYFLTALLVLSLANVELVFAVVAVAVLLMYLSNDFKVAVAETSHQRDRVWRQCRSRKIALETR